MNRVIKRDRVRVGESRRLETPSATPGAPRAAAGARLIQLEGNVQAIEVTCRCGTVSIVELELDADPAQASAETTS